MERQELLALIHKELLRLSELLDHLDKVLPEHEKRLQEGKQ